MVPAAQAPRARPPVLSKMASLAIGKEFAVAQKPYFLPYQQEWLADSSRMKIAEKSRRIGWTYTQAYEDVRDAAKSKDEGEL